MVPAPVFVPASTGFPIKVYTVPFQALHATHPSNSIPSRSSVDSATSSPMPGPTHVSWNELPEIVRTRLCVKYDFLKSRIWASWQGFTPFVWTRYTDALGSSTSMTSDGTVKTAMIKTIPDIRGVLKCGDHFCNFYELSNLHVFFNPLDATIDEALAEVDFLFVPSAILHLRNHIVPPTWRVYSASQVYGAFSIPEFTFTSIDIHEQVARNFVARTHRNTKFTRPHTLDLLQGLSRQLGFYFAYSPNKTEEDARKSNLSQDLILAIQELGTAMDTATHNREAMSHYTTLAQRCFYALYLTRIIVLSKFLDCIPLDVDSVFVPAEWTLFQHNPPRISDGDDAFCTVYRHVMGACGSVFDLKRTAAARFNNLVKSNKRFFSQNRTIQARDLPFYLVPVVDEVEAPIFRSPSSDCRPACSRLGVSALLDGFDYLS